MVFWGAERRQGPGVRLIEVTPTALNLMGDWCGSAISATTTKENPGA
jgi:hypothetical protein